MTEEEEKAFKRIRATLEYDRNLMDDEYEKSAFTLMEALEYKASQTAYCERLDMAHHAVRADRFSDYATPSKGEKAPALTSINTLLHGDTDVMAAREELIAARLELDMWTALCKSLERKGYDMNGLKDMLVTGYAARTSGYAPKPPGRYDGAAERAARDKAAAEQAPPPARKRQRLEW